MVTWNSHSRFLSTLVNFCVNARFTNRPVFEERMQKYIFFYLNEPFDFILGLREYNVIEKNGSFDSIPVVG